MAITGKVTLDLSQRTVGRLGLLWNKLTPTRGAKVVSSQIATASSHGPVTVSVSREQLSIRMGEQETPIYRSEAYARCLWKAGVREVEVGNGINSVEVKGTLNALADKDFITPSSRIGFDLKGLDGRTIETMKKGTSLGTISRTEYSPLSRLTLLGSIALAAGFFMLEGCSKKYTEAKSPGELALRMLDLDSLVAGEEHFFDGIQKKTFWDFIGINSDGYRSEIDLDNSGNITRNEAWRYFIDNFHSLPSEKKETFINFLIERTKTGPTGYANSIEQAFDILKELKYPEFDSLVLERFLKGSNKVSLAALLFLDCNKQAAIIRDRLLDMVKSNAFSFGDEIFLLQKALPLIDSKDHTDELIINECIRIISNGSNSGQPENALIILAEVHKMGYSRDLIKDKLKELLSSEDAFSYNNQEIILPIVFSDPSVISLIKDVDKRFFASNEDNSCTDFHPTARSSVCLSVLMNAHVKASLMLRKKPVGALPNYDRVRDLGLFGSITPKLAYLIAYIEKNMNNYSYKGHKIWEYESQDLFKKTFGEGEIICGGLIYQSQDATTRKEIAIKHLVIENPDLFEKTFPLDPRIEGIK